MADKKKRTLGDDLRDFRAGKIGDKFYRYNPVPFMVKTNDVKDTIPITSTKSNNLANGLVKPDKKTETINNPKQIANAMTNMLNNPTVLADKVKSDTQTGEVQTVPSKEQYYQRLANVKNTITVPSEKQFQQYQTDVNTLKQIDQYQNEQKYDRTYSGYNYAQLKAELEKTDSKTDKDLYSYLENKVIETATSEDLEKELEEQLKNADVEHKNTLMDWKNNHQNSMPLETDLQNKKQEIRSKYEKLINDKKKKENYTDVVSNNIKVLTAIQKYHEATQQDSSEQITDTYSSQHGKLQNQKYKAEDIEKIKATYESYKDKGYDMDKLYEYYLMDLEEQKNAQRIESLKDFGKEHPILGSVGSVATNTVGAVGDAFRYVGAGLNKLSGGDGYIDTNSTAVAQAQAIREGASENINSPIGEFLYNTGMSMGDFLSVLPLNLIPGLGQTASISLLGTSAGVSAANDVINNGGDISHALTTGIFAGCAEAFFEHFSLDKLKALQSTSPSNIRGVIKNGLKQGGIEASEEAFTEIANGLTDWLINDDLSNWSMQYNQYLEQGYSESTAWKMTAGNFAEQVGLAAAGGFISGGTIGTGASLISYGGYKLTQKDIENLKNKKNREVGEAVLAEEDFDLNNLIAQGKISGNQTAVKLAESIERTITKSGKEKITAGDVGNLIYLMSEDRPNNNYEVENPEKQEIINEKYTMGGAPKTEAVNVTQHTADNKNSKKTTDAFGEAHPNGLSVKTRTGGTLNVIGVDSSAKDFGASDNNVILITNNGGRINADDVTPTLPHFQQLFNYAKNFDTIGAKNFVKNYESYFDKAKKSGKEPSVEAYAKAFEDLYTLGKMGVTYDSVKKSGNYNSRINTLGGGIAYTATQAGNNDTNVTRQFEENKIQKIRVPGENNSINSRMYVDPGSESSVTASDEQLQLLQAVAQKVGKDIVLTNKLAEGKNGMYDGDKIYIRADLNENYMLAVGLHEATHDLRANSPLEYQALCEFIMNYLVAKGENVNSLLDNIKDNWKENVSTEDDVLEELVCQTVMAIATNEQAINTVLNIKENKNILKKVASALKKIAQYTYDFMKGIGFDRHNLQAQAWLDDAKAIQNLAEKLSSALDKNRNITTTQSTEQQKNNTQKGAKYSMEDFVGNDKLNFRYVDYKDETGKREIMQQTHQSMVEEGAVVKVSDEIIDKVSQSYPDLRSIKKKLRKPILKEAMKLLKLNIRSVLNGLKNRTFKFEIDNGVLEARLYNTGIAEVIEKVTQEKASMLYVTENIFKNSRYIYSTSDYENDPNIYRWNYFYSPVQIGDYTVGVRIAIRDVVSGTDSHLPESQIYNWGIKKDASLDGGSYDQKAASSDVSSDASNIIIQDSNQKSNTNTKNNSSNSKSSVDDTIRTDTEYMKAVENDDMITAQEMVDEYAVFKGFIYRRCTQNNLIPYNSVPWMMFVEAADSDGLLGVYGEYQFVAHGKGALDINEIKEDVKKLALQYNGIDLDEDSINPPDIVMSAGMFDDQDFVQYLWDNYFEELYLKNNEVPAIKTRNGLIVMAYDDSRIKSADPVTYDDNGNVIPLSERFKDTQKDIRYSVDDTITYFNDDWFLDEDMFWEGTEEHINFENVIKDSPADALNIIYNTASKTALTGIAQFKDVQLDDKAYTSIARKVMKDYRINKRYNPDAEAKIANTIRRYVQLIESGNYSDGADVIEKLVLECKGYIALSGDYDKTVLQEEREAILGYLSGKTLLITDYSEEFVRENYGNVAKYRRNMMGKVSVGLERNAKSMQNTMYMDDVISFIEEYYPMFITDECDSVQGFQWLDNLLNNVLQPKFFNRYADGFYENADTTAIEMAFDMTTEVISAKAKQIVTSQKADKKQVRELTKARKIAIAEREAMLKAKAENHKKQFQEERLVRTEQIKKLREKMQRQKQRSGKMYLSNIAKIEHLETQLDEKKMLLAIRNETIREEYTEGRNRTIYRARLGKMLDRMVKKLDGKAKNNEYIPESLKGPIIEVLGSFLADPGEYKNGKKKTLPGYFGEWKRIVEVGDRVRELKDAYSKLKTDNIKNPDYAFIDINSLAYHESTFKVLEKLSEQISNKNIYELNADDLQALYTTMVELDESLKSAVEIILDGQRVAIKAAAERGITETEGVNFKKGVDKFNNTALNVIASSPYDLRNSYLATHYDPVRYGRFLSGYHDEYVMPQLMTDLHEGDKNRMKIIQEAFLSVQAVTSKYSNGELKILQRDDVKKFNFQDINTGKRVKISRGMLVAIYLTDRQADGHRHLANDNYNHYTVIPDLDMMNLGLDGHGDKSHKVRFSEVDLRNIKAYVESNQLLKELSGAVSEVYNTVLAQHINEVSMKKYGMLIATVKNYYPLHIYKDGAKYEKNFEVEFNDIRMKSRGFTQNRIFSYAPIVIDDVLKTFTQHVESTAEYCGLLIPIENFKKVYNSSNGDITLHEAIKEKFGTSAEHYIEKLMADLQRAPDVLDNSIIQKTQSNFMGAKLLLNPGSAIKQLAAYPTAYRYFGFGNVSKASVAGVVNYKKLCETYSKYTPYLWYRKEGNGTVVGELSRELGFTKKIREKADIMGKLDQVVVGSLLYAAELHVEQTTDLQRGTEAFYKEAAHQFEKCVDETQPNNMLTSKPQFIRNNVMRILSLNAFRSQNMAIANTILDSSMEYSARKSDFKDNKNAETKKAKKEAALKFAGSLIGATTSSMLIGVLNILTTLFLWHKWEDFRDDEGEVTFKTLSAKFLDYSLESLTGLFAWGDTAYQAISSIVKGENFYGLEVMSTENINDAISKITQGDFVAIATLLVDCFGYPGENGLKIVRSLWSYGNDLLNGRGDIISAKNSFGELNTDHFNYIIVRAKQNGEIEKAEHFEDMWIDYLMDKKGKTKEQATETIKDKLVTALATSDDDVELAARAFANGDLETYETHLNKVIGYGFDSKDVKNAVDKVISNIIIKLKDDKITQKEDVFEDLKEQGFNDKGCEYIYNEMQNSTEEESEEVASVFDDTSDDKGVAYTYSDAFEALKSGDKDNYNHIKNYLIEEAGKEEKDIKSAMRSTSRTDPLWKEYIQAYEDNDGTKMREIKTMLTNIYGSWDTALEAMHRYQKRMKEKENN